MTFQLDNWIVTSVSTINITFYIILLPIFYIVLTEPNKNLFKIKTDEDNFSLIEDELTKEIQSAEKLKSTSRGNILEKLKAAAPYYFFLSSAMFSKETHTDSLSLQLFDILDPALGDLECSLHINGKVDFVWLMAQYGLVNQLENRPITLLYDDIDVEKEKITNNNITSVDLKAISIVGRHETRLCVLAYKDGSVRVCVHTANLVEEDWYNRTQGVWLSPSCPPLPLGADSSAGESPTNFKHDLIQYLLAYQLTELQPWVAKLQKANFSQINVFFVATIPGYYKGADADKWGITRLASLLHKHVQKISDAPSVCKIIAQCSNVGSLGMRQSDAFCKEIIQAMSRGLESSFGVPFWLVYPTHNNVALSYDGVIRSDYRNYSNKASRWRQYQHWQWKADRRHRTRAMPRLNTYTRISTDYSQAAWFLLTSASLSFISWGSCREGLLHTGAYGAGVLFMPKFIVPTKGLPLKKEFAGNIPVFPIPYDLPLKKYEELVDAPWSRYYYS